MVFLGRRQCFMSIVSNRHIHSRRSVETVQYYRACCRGKGLQWQGWLVPQRCSQHAQAGTKNQLCQYCQKKQTFVAEVIFPLNRFPSINLPVVWGICRQRNLHLFLHLFQYFSPNYCKLDMVLLLRVCNTSTIFEEPCEASVGELALKACSILYRVYSSAWFNKVDSPTDEHGCAVEHLALPCSQQALCSHDTAPLCSTC